MLLLGAGVAGAFLLGALREPTPTSPAPPPPVQVAEAPSRPFDPAAMARVEVSAAARQLGEDCVLREQIACTCPYPVAAGWCAEARRENEAGASATSRQGRLDEINRCTIAIDMMRAQCFP